MAKQPYQASMILLIWSMSALLLSCVLPDATDGQHVTGRRDYEAITGTQVGITPDADKVSGRLRAVMNEMEARGITRQHAKELGAAALSMALVRVNEAGDIQTYLYVSTFGDAETARLKTYEVSIELTNEELGIIQAWIPFDRIDAVAQLPFVRRITPPRYGTTRGDSATTEGHARLGAAPKPTGSEQSRISVTIRSLIHDMQAGGITRHNATQRQAASYSTPLVKVDKQGNIHTVIHVKTLNDMVIAELKAKQVDIEITNVSLKRIQAWVPFNLVAEVAELAVVERIEPPSDSPLP